MMGEEAKEEQSYGEFVADLHDTLQRTFQDCRDHLQIAQRRQKDNYDRWVKHATYNPGDQVLLYNPQVKPGEAAKFHRYRVGPYVVLQRITEVNYKLYKEGDRRRRLKVVHFDNMRLFRRNLTEESSATKTAERNQSVLENEERENEEDQDVGALELQSNVPVDNELNGDLSVQVDISYEEQNPIDEPDSDRSSQADTNHDLMDNEPHSADLSSQADANHNDLMDNEPDSDLSSQADVNHDDLIDNEHDSDLPSQVNTSHEEDDSTREDDVSDQEESISTPEESDEYASRRPSRQRNPPDRYGDWDTSILSVMKNLAGHITRLTEKEDRRRKKILKMKPRWLRKGRQLRLSVSN